MILLLDAGNTRLKWAVSSEHKPLQHFGHAPYHDLSALSELLDYFKPQHIYGVAVCTQENQRHIEQLCPSPVLWQSARQEALGIINQYQNSAELGADRWFNILGARIFNQTNALLVVSCGTAITIDTLTADNHYLGGSIMPGIQLMHSVLNQHTAQLKRPLGKHQDFARNTPDALATGIIDAACGAINRQKERLAALHPKQTIKIILTGGNASTIHPFLDKNTQTVDNLVLYGLARWISL